MLADTVPVAAGAALAFKLRGEDRASPSCYNGEGATSRGDWHEGINLAAVQKLPVRVLRQQQPVRLLDADRLSRWPSRTSPTARRPTASPANVIDGNDVVAVYRTASAPSTGRARAGALRWSSARPSA